MTGSEVQPSSAGLRRVTGPIASACIGVALAFLAGCSGSSTGSDGGVTNPSSAPPRTQPVTLNVSRNCRNAEVWGVSSDGTIGVRVVTRESQPSSDQASVIDFDATSATVDFIAYRGTDLTNQLCGPSGKPNAARLKVVSGSGRLALDALGPIPMGGRLTTTELDLEDGTVVAPMDLTATCIGCFPT